MSARHCGRSTQRAGALETAPVWWVVGRGQFHVITSQTKYYEPLNVVLSWMIAPSVRQMQLPDGLSIPHEQGERRRGQAPSAPADPQQFREKNNLTTRQQMQKGTTFLLTPYIFHQQQLRIEAPSCLRLDVVDCKYLQNLFIITWQSIKRFIKALF